MAGVGFHVSSDEVALPSGTALSVIQVKAAANHRVLIREIGIFGKQAAGGTDAPVKIRMTRNSANFGTFTSLTPHLDDPSIGDTIQATAGSNASVEPTTPTDTGRWWEIQPQLWEHEFLPIEAPIPIPPGQSVQFEATSAATPTIVIVLGCEE